MLLTNSLIYSLVRNGALKIEQSWTLEKVNTWIVNRLFNKYKKQDLKPLLTGRIQVILKKKSHLKKDSFTI